MRIRDLFRRTDRAQPEAHAFAAAERGENQETVRLADQESQEQRYRAEQEAQEQLCRDVARARRDRGDDDALRAEWLKRGPAAGREIAELDSQVGDDRYWAEESHRYHEEQEVQARAVRDRVVEQRREHGDDAALRWELTSRVRETGQTCHENELMTGGGEGWWTWQADDAARELVEFDRQVRDELGDDGLEALRHTRPERESRELERRELEDEIDDSPPF